MKSNCRERNVIKSRKIIENDTVYQYDLILFEGETTASFGITLYGINIEMKTSEVITSYKSGGLFSNEEKALRFFEMIIDKKVTPIDLPYVIEDSFCF